MIFFISLIVEIRFEKNYYIKDGFVKFNLKNYYQEPFEGYPDIPVIPYIIRIPGRIRNFSYRILEIDTLEILRNIYIGVAEKPQIISLPYKKKNIERKSIVQYPESIVCFEGLSYIRDTSLILFKVFPAIQKNDKVIFFNSIKIQLDYEKEEEKKNEKIDSIELAIITKNQFIGYFEPLKRWKTEKGIPARIFDFDSIINVSTGRDNQEKLRNFIKILYSNYNLKYVILGGDVGVIPARITFAMCSEAGIRYDEDSLRADLYYADLDGDWDFDQDNIFGEISDSIDLIPEIAIGRIPVNSANDVINFVDKLISYEKNPGENILKFLFSGMVLWQNPYTDAGIAKDRIIDFLPQNIAVSRMYESNYLGNHNVVWNELNSGNGFFNHNGHGWYTGMWTASGNYISIPDVETLSNTTYTIGFSTGCWVGAFDYNSIAEHFIISKNCGVAMISNSRYGWGSPGNPGFGYSDRFDEMFFYKIFVDNVKTIGDALSETKIFFAPLSKTENVYRWHQYQLNLFGDPSMCMWKRIPDTFKLVFIDSNRVRIMNNSNPVESAYVCMYGKYYRRFYTDPTGEFTIYEDTCILTITKDGFLPLQILRNFTPPRLYDILISDSDDNLINPGETLFVSLYIKNNQDTIKNKVTKLISDKTILLKDSLFISELLPGRDTTIKNCFKIYAPIDLKDGEEVRFTVISEDSIIRHFFVAKPEIIINNVKSYGDTILVFIFNRGHTYIDSIIRKAYSFPSSINPVDTIGRIYPSEFFIDTLVFPDFFNSTVNYVLKKNNSVILDSLFIFTDYSEFFDECEDDRNFYYNDLWHLTSHRKYSGIYSWYCGNDSFHYNNNQVSILETRKFLPKGSVNLSFYYWYKFPNYGSDGMYVVIYEKGKEDTIDFIGSGGALYPIQDGWIKWEKDIHTSDTFSIKFIFSSDSNIFDEGIYIDNLLLRNVFLEKNELPGKGEYIIINNLNLLNILYNSEKSGIVKLRIYDILGRERIEFRNIFRGINNINLRFDKSGVYFVFLEDKFIGKVIILEEK